MENESSSEKIGSEKKKKKGPQPLFTEREVDNLLNPRIPLGTRKRMVHKAIIRVKKR